MATQAAGRKIKRSFTLAPESVTFLTETRGKRCTGSDSETLDLLLGELRLEAKRRELDAAIKAYYDSATDEELAEQHEWAEMAGPAFLADSEEAEANR
jgi:hypothetical protein